MAKIIKWQDTKYPGIKIVSYASGTKDFDTHVVYNGNVKLQVVGVLNTLFKMLETGKLNAVTRYLTTNQNTTTA
jgi:hypothetical protein